MTAVTAPAAACPPAAPASERNQGAPRERRALTAFFSPGPAQAPAARRFVTGTLARWGLDGHAAEAELIAAELFGNALRAVTGKDAPAAPAIMITMAAGPGMIRVYAWDNGPGCPRARRADGEDESGRGLAIIGELSAGWGWYPTPPTGGKTVWAEISTEGGQ